MTLTLAIKDIPGYKVILKTVLKGVFQQMVSNDSGYQRYSWLKVILKTVLKGVIQQMVSNDSGYQRYSWL